MWWKIAKLAGLFFRIRAAQDIKYWKISTEYLLAGSCAGDSVPCVIWTDALECMGCRTGMWNCISHDIEMVWEGIGTETAG